MDNLSAISVEEKIDYDFSLLQDEVKKGKSNQIPIQNHQMITKRSRHAHFNQIGQQEQCNSPIKVGTQLQDFVSRPPIHSFSNKNRKVVLGSIDKFLQKAQNMQRELIASYQIRSTANNSKKAKKSLYRTPQQFVLYFKQTMFQLKELLMDVSIFVENVKKMFDSSKAQVAKFQQNFKQSSSNSKLIQAIDNFHNLSQELQKIPITNQNDFSMYTDKVGYAILTSRKQQKKQQNQGKIIKVNQKRMTQQLFKDQSSNKFEMINQSAIEKKGDYHKVSLDDINQMTNNMKKLLDML